MSINAEDNIFISVLRMVLESHAFPGVKKRLLDQIKTVVWVDLLVVSDEKYPVLWYEEKEHRCPYTVLFL